MATVHIVTDSIAQIPREMLEQHSNLHIVSLKVRLGDKEWREDELSTAELFQLEKESKQIIRTSQPAPGDFLAVFEPILAAGENIVVITVSGGLSGTVDGARSVANMLDAKRIHVVDSCTASVGMVQLVKAALVMAEQGLTAKEIAQKIEKRVKVTHTFIVPATLNYLHKGGRIGGAAALFGTILQIRPILFLERDGKVAVMDKVRTKQRAVQRMVEELQKYSNLEYVGVGHIDVPEEGEALRSRLKELMPEIPILTASIGSVLGAHLGPGLVGFIFQEKIDD